MHLTLLLWQTQHAGTERGLLAVARLLYLRGGLASGAFWAERVLVLESMLSILYLPYCGRCECQDERKPPWMSMFPFRPQEQHPSCLFVIHCELTGLMKDRDRPWGRPFGNVAPAPRPAPNDGGISADVWWDIFL